MPPGCCPHFQAEPGAPSANSQVVRACMGSSPLQSAEATVRVKVGAAALFLHPLSPWLSTALSLAPDE